MKPLIRQEYLKMCKLIINRFLDMEKLTCVLDLIPAEPFYGFIKDRICVTVVYKYM
jgi:hypothetical protein